jgi:hypothetical protein
MVVFQSSIPLFPRLDDTRAKAYLISEEKMSEAQKQSRLTAFAHSGG